MTRSYDPSELAGQVDAVARALLSAWKTPAAAMLHDLGGYAPWRGVPGDWLVELALEQSGDFERAEYAAVGLEPGLFLANARCCPELRSALSFGPEIRDRHSVNERLRIDTLAPVEEALQRLLVRIAEAPEFRG